MVVFFKAAVSQISQAAVMIFKALLQPFFGTTDTFLSKHVILGNLSSYFFTLFVLENYLGCKGFPSIMEKWHKTRGLVHYFFLFASTFQKRLVMIQQMIL